MTDDDFDLDALRQTLVRATPRPDPARRAANLQLAQKNLTRHQESAAAARPIPEPPRRGIRSGARNMLRIFSGKGAMALTTAMVAGGAVLLLPPVRTLWQVDLPPGLLHEPPPAVVTAPNAPPPARPEPTPSAAAPEADTRGATAEITPTPTPDATAPMAPPTQPSLPAPAPAAPKAVAPQPGSTARHHMADRMQSLADGGWTAGIVAHSTGAAAYPGYTPPLPPVSREAFANAPENPLQVTAEAPVSTFSIDVDTASWALVRQSLNHGQLPPVAAVRVEEMVNYFPYSYPVPEGDAAFRPAITVLPTPWNPDTRLVQIGIQGRMPAIAERPPLNLVFLIDTSGSMATPERLPLLKAGFRLMLGQLRPTDRVAIVTYAGSTGVALEPTPAAERDRIARVIDGLQARGATAGYDGLGQAYAVARQMAGDGDVTRVILATDGDFNVGPASLDEIDQFVTRQRESGIYLSVLGFGRSNLNDALMQTLAQNGNGNAAYIDTLAEARKVLVDQLTGTLFPIAGDVKVQVEWNPATVAEYRLIGYETRGLRREDFNNDRVDAGDLGAGHTVTALYEVTPTGSPAMLVDPLRYAPAPGVTGGADSAGAGEGDSAGELGFLRLRWKAPGAEASALLEVPIRPDTADAHPEDAQFAAAIAGFGQLLRQSDWIGGWTWADAIALATTARGDDPFGYRAEAINLMHTAAALAASAD